ncbi:MAG: hypothetical protein ACOX3R_00745 [Desulfitobacteriia bacterium]|jgi:hypothetical protein
MAITRCKCNVCGKEWTGDYNDLQLITCTCGADNSVDGTSGRELNGGVKVVDETFVITHKKIN